MSSVLPSVKDALPVEKEYLSVVVLEEYDRSYSKGPFHHLEIFPCIVAIMFH